MPSAGEPIEWPDRKAFAFTVVDDTDTSTLENVKPVYDFMEGLGLRTTKTVWPLSPLDKAITGGDSLENPAYREWIVELQSRGFEIALHGAADGSSHRERIVEAFQRFKEAIGHDPTIHVNHTGQTEGLYWGARRLDPPVRWIYNAYRPDHSSDAYRGVDPSGPYFWGDLCEQKIKYVRNLVFPDINTLKMDPLMPYHDSGRPYVRYWFSSSYGSGVDTFCRLISEINQDRLVREGGACIVYTHFGSTFYPLRDDFKHLLRRLASLPGWFVPATTLLDFVGSQRGWCNVADHRMKFQKMQWNWLLQQAVRRVRP